MSLVEELTVKRDDTEDGVRALGVHLSKPAVIAIGTVVTMVVLGIVGGVAVYMVRRRRVKRLNGKHGMARNTDDNGTPYSIEQSSKVPLIQQERHGETQEVHDADSHHHRDDQHVLLSPTMPHRTLSGATARSLPPSYAAATHGLETGDDNASMDHSRHESTSDGPRGLRALTLVESQHDAHHLSSRQASPETSHGNRLSVLRPATHERSRSTSRFREEDLDS